MSYSGGLKAAARSNDGSFEARTASSSQEHPAEMAAQLELQPLTEEQHVHDQHGEDQYQDKGPYCVCNGPEVGFMIGCEGGCDGWFHGDCVSIVKEDEDILDYFVCPACTTYTTKKTVWKTCEGKGLAVVKDAALAYDDMLKMWQAERSAEAAAAAAAKQRASKTHHIPRVRIDGTGPQSLPLPQKKPEKSPTQAITRATQLGLRQHDPPAQVSGFSRSPLHFEDDANDKEKDKNEDQEYTAEEEVHSSSSEVEAASSEKGLFVGSSSEDEFEDEEMEPNTDVRANQFRLSTFEMKALRAGGLFAEDSGVEEDEDDYSDIDIEKLMNYSRLGPEAIEQTFAHRLAKEAMEKKLFGSKG